LQRAVAAGAGTFAAPAILSAKSPNGRLNIAVIGCGGRGAGNLHEVRDENIVALCDVNQANLSRAAKQFPQARTFTDFRKLYDELSDADFDAVVVSTTEHTHAFATLPALRRKKHVYCEKPLAHNAVETRLITEAAKAAGVATQMGTQIHAGSNYRRVVELVQGGALGPVREAHVWVDRAWGLQSPADAKIYHDIVTVTERPMKSEAVPPGLDWDLWLGPAMPRPFHSVYFPGPKWCRWWDFGSGTMSDLGSHWNDLPFWALKLDAPQSVEAAGPPPHLELAPASMQATYEYAARGEMPALKLTWYQGVNKPVAWTQGKIPQWGSGVLFVGDRASLLADYSRHQLLVANDKLDKFAPFALPKKSIPESIGHHAEWVHACKTGAATTCPFSYSGPLTEANHLGNVAYRAGTRIEWDARNLKIPNAPQAERFLTREYRPGWTLG
jgi:predicted dehydrogenase